MYPILQVGADLVHVGEEILGEGIDGAYAGQALGVGHMSYITTKFNTIQHLIFINWPL